MPDALRSLRRDIAIANRILAQEGLLDTFGHVSARHPHDASRYLLSRSRAPELVEADDVIEFTLDSEPVAATDARLYAERVIHGCIYRLRPDVQAVCHHHAPAIMPYTISGTPLVPVFLLGAAIGREAPFWDSRDDFGDTNLLVAKPEEGLSLARALGQQAIVLMRRHGATVVGTSLAELVFRSVYSARNAEFQTQAQAHGIVSPLSPGEIERAAAAHAKMLPRAWEYWVTRLQKRGELPPECAP